MKKEKLADNYQKRKAEIEHELKNLKPNLQKNIKQVDIDANKTAKEEKEMFEKMKKQLNKEMPKEDRKAIDIILKQAKPQDIYQQKYVEKYFEDVKKEYTTMEKVPVAEKKRGPFDLFKPKPPVAVTYGELGKTPFLGPWGTSGSNIHNGNRYAQIYKE